MEDDAYPEMTINRLHLRLLAVECEPTKCLHVDWLKLGRRKFSNEDWPSYRYLERKSHAITNDPRRQVFCLGKEKLSLQVNQKLTVTHSDGCGDTVATTWTLWGWVPTGTLSWTRLCHRNGSLVSGGESGLLGLRASHLVFSSVSVGAGQTSRGMTAAGLICLSLSELQVGMPDVACPFSFLRTWFKSQSLAIVWHWKSPLLSQPGQVYPVSCSDHCWKKNRVARHVSHVSEPGWPYGWLWISLSCWRSVQTGCCQSVNGAQAFQFSHGEVCVTEPRGQTQGAMPVCALLDAQPHLPPPPSLT